MNLLIAIMSCQADRRYHNAVRDTWLRNFPKWGVDYRFFLAALPGKKYMHDELGLDCPDGYEFVTEKSRALFTWALERQYDFVLHCGRDTYINVPRLLCSGLEGVDYAGNCNFEGKAQWASSSSDHQGRYSYTCGGAGTWLSRKAMEIIVNDPLRHEADDLLYGWILGRHGIYCWHDPRFQRRGQYIDNKHNLTVHLSQGTGNYNPQWMYEAHVRSL